MKRSIIDMANLMHSADPDARFAFELWDGEIIVHGNQPVVSLRFRSKEGAKKVLCNGFLDLVKLTWPMTLMLRAICKNYCVWVFA